MPNWCSNTLKVTTENAEKLKEFYNDSVIEDKDKTEWSKFTLNNLFPTPPELLNEGAFSKSENSEELVKKYGSSDWYTWRVNNWGTKWDVSESYISENSEDELVINFDSAWSPPVAWLVAIAPKFPELKFSLSYEEPGCDFCGYIIIENGQVIETDEDIYQFFDEETDKQIEFNSELQKWCFLGTNDVVSDDENYWPEGRNPFADMI